VAADLIVMYVLALTPCCFYITDVCSLCSLFIYWRTWLQLNSNSWLY